MLLPFIATASHTPSGWYGFTLAPPIAASNNPPADNAESRTTSPSIRKRGPRDSSRFSGSRFPFSGVVTAACRYAADVTISLNIPFTFQPDSRNSTASQSSNSGCDGGVPCDPKSSAVFTIPVPKTSCQNRLIATRATSGFAGSTSHFASPKRFRGNPASIPGNTAGTFAGTSSRGASYMPRCSIFATGLRSLRSCITSVTAPRFRICRASSFNAVIRAVSPRYSASKSDKYVSVPSAFGHALNSDASSAVITRLKMSNSDIAPPSNPRSRSLPSSSGLSVEMLPVSFVLISPPPCSGITRPFKYNRSPACSRDPS